MNVLVTGGAGYIGSHTVVELIAAGHSPIIVDNFCNSSSDVLDRLRQITGTKIHHFDIDITDTDQLTAIMQNNNIESVIHFAALKAVGQSVSEPLMYYHNNVFGLISVLEAMAKSNVANLIFSSSAVIYGDPDKLPITEDAPNKPATNPYGSTKQMGEQIITDTCKSSALKAVLLRYFNPIGAHSSGLIGELPLGPPNNLVPYVAQTAAKIRDHLTVHGNDYDTPNGTGIRDYIHVVDLAKAHVMALDYVVRRDSQNITALNLGTGAGTSVLDVIKTFEQVNNIQVPYSIGPRRPGDIASCYADPSKAKAVLGWEAELSLSQALKDTWTWQLSLGDQ